MRHHTAQYSGKECDGNKSFAHWISPGEENVPLPWRLHCEVCIHYDTNGPRRLQPSFQPYCGAYDPVRPAHVPERSTELNQLLVSYRDLAMEGRPPIARLIRR